uniref:Receptor expression-enhancing protein n=1 Tax=Steinernema glaseri TaxID=37863 RepID=A0A1I7YRE4_9BILA
MDSFPWPISAINGYVSSFLYQQENPQLKSWIEKIETSTGIKREKVFYSAFFVVVLYLILGSLAQFLCNLCGFAYPAYASVKAVRTKEADDDRKWLIYWTVFAFFSIVDFFAESIMGIFPAYWLLKAAFLVYLYLPQTNGAKHFFDSYVDPTITQIDNIITNYFYVKAE